MMHINWHKIIRIIAQLISLVFHPVFVPLYTVWLYFNLTTRFFLPVNRNFLILYLAIVGILIPLLFFSVILQTKTFSGYQLKYPFERLIFSVIMAVVYSVIFQKIYKYRQFVELFPLLIGIILSVLTLAVNNYFKVKPSIHAVGVTGSISFFIIWSYYSQINILNYLSIFIVTATLIMASRVYLGAHNLKEIIGGIAIGILMQLAGFYIAWLYF